MNHPAIKNVTFTPADAPTDAPRLISTIANEIEKTWPKVNYAARPYLDAMKSLGVITDQFYFDDAKSILIYFLGNAQSWRGDDARRIKAEIKALYS